jgi:hypothetical protein
LYFHQLTSLEGIRVATHNVADQIYDQKLNRGFTMSATFLRFFMCIAIVIAHSSLAVSAEIACDSIDGSLHRCALAAAEKMKVKLKTDRKGSCKKGKNWGISQDEIWVDMGCNAIFTYKSPTDIPWWKRLTSPKRAR